MSWERGLNKIETPKRCQNLNSCSLFSGLWGKEQSLKPHSRNHTWRTVYVVACMGYRLNPPGEPGYWLKPLPPEFGIHLRLESCERVSQNSFLLRDAAIYSPATIKYTSGIDYKEELCIIHSPCMNWKSKSWMWLLVGSGGTKPQKFDIYFQRFLNSAQ